VYVNNKEVPCRLGLMLHTKNAQTESRFSAIDIYIYIYIYIYININLVTCTAMQGLYINNKSSALMKNRITILAWQCRLPN